MSNSHKTFELLLLLCILLSFENVFACWKRVPEGNVRLEDNKLKQLDEDYSKCQGIEIRELTIDQVHTLFETNRLTSEQLTMCYIKRIEKMNGDLKAVIEINPNAIHEARKADMERNSSEHLLDRCVHGTMHGIPIILKDNIATENHMMTTVGSKAFLGLRPIKDADVVKKLRRAGAVIIGKANLSELSGLRNYDLGCSSVGGKTLNPYNLRASPYGSSSGSATAVAANLAMVSLATETDGSLNTPASVAGVFGLKPTIGVVSSEGLVPVSTYYDSIGPMARTMMDLAIVFDTIVRRSHKKEYACGHSYLACLTKENLKFNRKLNIGIIRHPFLNPEALFFEGLTNQLPQLEQLFNKIQNSSHFFLKNVESPAGFLKKVSLQTATLVYLYSLKHDLNEYLAKNVTIRDNSAYPVHSLNDIILFNKQHGDKHSQVLLELAQDIDELLETEEYFLEIRNANQLAAKDVLDYAFIKYELDVLLFPVPMGFGADLTTEYVEESLRNVPVWGYTLAAIAGYPTLNVPIGIDKYGVPFGVTLVGLPNTDGKLLQIGYLLEKLSSARQPPKFLP